MGTDDLFVASWICPIVFAALGMQIAGGAAWKGSLFGGIFIAITMFLVMVLSILFLLFVRFFSFFSFLLFLPFLPFLSLLGGVFVVGKVARIMNVPARQSSNVLLGCALGFCVPITLMVAY